MLLRRAMQDMEQPRTPINATITVGVYACEKLSQRIPWSGALLLRCLEDAQECFNKLICGCIRTASHQVSVVSKETSSNCMLQPMFQDVAHLGLTNRTRHHRLGQTPVCTHACEYEPVVLLQAQPHLSLDAASKYTLPSVLRNIHGLRGRTSFIRNSTSRLMESSRDAPPATTSRAPHLKHPPSAALLSWCGKRAQADKVAECSRSSACLSGVTPRGPLGIPC